MMTKLWQQRGVRIGQNLLREIIAAGVEEIPRDYEADAALAEAVEIPDHQRSPAMWRVVIGEQVKKALADGYLERFRRSALSATG